MIDERLQELASLYAFDLLEGAERVEFEAALTGDPELQRLVAELRHSASQLSHTAPTATPPPELKERIFATIDQSGAPRAATTGTASGAVTSAEADNIVAFRRSTFGLFLGWGLAAGFALCAIWLGERYYLAEARSQQLDNARALADLALKSAETQLEAERLTNGKLAGDFKSLEESAQHAVAAAKQAQADAEQKFAALQQSAAATAAQLVEARDAVAAAKAETVALNDRLKRESDLARLKIATLASMLHNTPEALAVAVWDPTQQQGVFTVDRLPANAADQRYELWVIDGAPVSAGVFTVGADGRAKVEFKPSQRVHHVAKFAVSREKNDGIAYHQTPGEVIMISQ